MKKKKRIKQVLLSIFFILICIPIVYPIWRILLQTFVRPFGFRDFPINLIPYGFTTAGWSRFFYLKSFHNAVVRSLSLAFGGAVIGTLSTVICSVVLAEKEMPGNKLLKGLLLFLLFFEVGLVPQYWVIQRMKLYGSFWAVILPNAVNVFMVFWLKEKMEDCFISLRDAAKLDGCSQFGLYRYIILPFSKPYISIIFVHTFINFWNDYINPKLYLRGKNGSLDLLWGKITSEWNFLPVFVCGGENFMENVNNICISIGLLVPLILFLCFQKSMTAEPLLGAIKE